MSEWTVKKAARALRPGDRFIFADDLGGEGEVVTVESAANLFGTVEVQTEELDFTIDLNFNQVVTMAPPEEDDEPPGVSRIEEEHDYKFGEWRL